MYRRPNLSGQVGLGGDSDHPSDFDNEVAQRAVTTHRDRTGIEDGPHRTFVTGGIVGLDPRILHISIEQAATMDEKSSEDEPVAKAAPKPKAKPLCPIFPIGPKTDVRTSPPAIGHDGTPNLSKVKTAAVFKDQKSIQRQLTQELRDNLTGECYAAAHSAGAAPVFLYNNDVRAVLVHPGHIWGKIHRSHEMYRCDFTAYCRRCGSSSSSYATTKLKDPCNVANRHTTYHSRLLEQMDDGKCPYPDGWKSGLDKSVRWPPCELHVYVGGGGTHHTKCSCDVGN